MTQQVYQPPDIRRISKRGRQIFAALDSELREKHCGQFIAIEVDSGDYFIRETAMEANQKACAKHPGNELHARLEKTLQSGLSHIEQKP